MVSLINLTSFTSIISSTILVPKCSLWNANCMHVSCSPINDSQLKYQSKLHSLASEAASDLCVSLSLSLVVFSLHYTLPSSKNKLFSISQYAMLLHSSMPLLKMVPLLRCPFLFPPCSYLLLFFKLTQVSLLKMPLGWLKSPSSGLSSHPVVFSVYT